jgi:hypothetical protein
MNYAATFYEGSSLKLDLTNLPRQLATGERITLRYHVENSQDREIHLVQGKVSASFTQHDKKFHLQLEKIAEGTCPCCDPGAFPQLICIRPGELYSNEFPLQFFVYWPGEWKFVFSAGFIDAEGMDVLQDCAESDDRTRTLIAEQKILILDTLSLNVTSPDH